MPDEELQALAETGKLSQPAVMDTQVAFTLADPKASAMAAFFVGQWSKFATSTTSNLTPRSLRGSLELRDAFKTETITCVSNCPIGSSSTRGTRV